MNPVKNSKTLVQSIEVFVRRTLYIFLSFYVLKFMVYTFTPDLLNRMLGSVPMYIPVLSAIAIPLTILIRSIAKRLINEPNVFMGMEQEDFNLIKPFIHRISIVAFYLLIQSGIIAIFLPNWGNYYVSGIPMALVVILINCFIIYMFYNKYIFKTLK